MRLTIPMLILAKLAVAGAAQPLAELQKAIDSALYRIERSGNGFSAVNHRQNLQMSFTGKQSEFVYQSSRLRLSLADEGPVLRSVAEGKRISFQHARVTEWFVNDPAGLEQGFTVASRRGAGELALTLDTGGDLRPAMSGQEIVFRDASRTVLRYGELKSWDADGRALPSRAVVEDRTIRLEVDDAGARYPVTVDPVIQQATLTPVNNDTDSFAFALALSGDGNTALIGTLGNVAYLFIRSDGAWVLQKEFLWPGGVSLDNNFGNAVALSIDGNVALIGANAEGAAYVFTRSGTVWSQPQRLSDAAGGGSFGNAVALSADGSTALIGAELAENGAGAAHVFTNLNGQWSEAPPLTQSDATTSDQFGFSVALSGDGQTALIGDQLKSPSGAAYVFTRSGNSWSQAQKLTPSDAAASGLFGRSVSASSDGRTLLVGASGANSYTGAGYVFTLASSTWTQTAKLTASDGAADAELGVSSALSADGRTALLGETPQNSNNNAAYVFTLSGAKWTQQAEVTVPGVYVFANAVALSADATTALIGGYPLNAAYVFSLDNISVTSIPAGRSITISGSGCPAGTFVTPYAGNWSGPCSVQWTSPDVQHPGVRYTFQNWYDGGTANPRTLSPQPLTDPGLYTYAAQFLTEYQLTTFANPATGQISPPTGAFYAAGEAASVIALPNPGFVFTGFSGAVTGETSPQTIVMSGPKKVDANFAPTPATTETAVVSGKSGAANARQWTINVTNSGPGAAFDTQLVGLMFTQTFGATCATLPVRGAPMFPVSLGDLHVSASAQATVTLDFSGCPANARFTVVIDSVSNGGASVGLIQLVNQLQ